MKRILFVGDTHNDLNSVLHAGELARRHGAEMVQLGDFGFLWPGDDQLQALSDMLIKLRVTLRFIDGNHDDHPRLRSFVKECIATTIAPNVIYQPRGSVHEDEDGTRFLFLGGAPSIDRAHRIPGLSWWPEEEISEAETQRALAAPEPIHVLVTHDAPELPPGVSAGVGNERFRRAAAHSTRAIFTVMHKFRPDLLVHGHYHRRYSRVSHGTIVEGLASNLQRFEDLTFEWSRES